MKFCGKCGNALTPQQKFCTKCGTPNPTFQAAEAVPVYQPAPTPAAANDPELEQLRQEKERIEKQMAEQEQLKRQQAEEQRRKQQEQEQLDRERAERDQRQRQREQEEKIYKEKEEAERQAKQREEALRQQMRDELERERIKKELEEQRRKQEKEETERKEFEEWKRQKESGKYDEKPAAPLAMKTNAKQEVEVEKPRTGRKIMVVLLVLFLVAGLSAAGYVGYMKYFNKYQLAQDAIKAQDWDAAQILLAKLLDRGAGGEGVAINTWADGVDKIQVAVGNGQKKLAAGIDSSNVKDYTAVMHGLSEIPLEKLSNANFGSLDAKAAVKPIYYFIDTVKLKYVEAMLKVPHNLALVSGKLVYKAGNTVMSIDSIMTSITYNGDAAVSSLYNSTNAQMLKAMATMSSGKTTDEPETAAANNNAAPITNATPTTKTTIPTTTAKEVSDAQIKKDLQGLKLADCGDISIESANSITSLTKTPMKQDGDVQYNLHFIVAGHKVQALMAYSLEGSNYICKSKLIKSCD